MKILRSFENRVPDDQDICSTCCTVLVWNMDSVEEGQAANLGFWDEALSMGTSHQSAADGYKYCGDELSLIKMESCRWWRRGKWTCLGISIRGLVKTMMFGRMDSKQVRRRPHREWLDDIMDRCGIKVHQLVEMAQTRTTWWQTVHLMCSTPTGNSPRSNHWNCCHST